MKKTTYKYLFKYNTLLLAFVLINIFCSGGCDNSESSNANEYGKITPFEKYWSDLCEFSVTQCPPSYYNSYEDCLDQIPSQYQAECDDVFGYIKCLSENCTSSCLAYESCSVQCVLEYCAVGPG